MLQYSQSRKTSSLINGVSHSKHCMPSPMARRSYATSQLSSINQHRKENKSSLHDESRRFAAPSIERLDNFVAQRVAPKSVKLEGNVSNTDIPQALTKLSCSMSKSEEKSVSTKVRSLTEVELEFLNISIWQFYFHKVSVCRPRKWQNMILLLTTTKTPSKSPRKTAKLHKKPM